MTTQPALFTAEELIAAETLINRYNSDIKKTRENLKIQNDMLRDAVEGDAAYHELSVQAKDLKKKMNEIKAKIMKTPSMEAVVAKVEEYKEEIKDAKEMLSAYLTEYVDRAGTNIINGENGETLRIVESAKLSKTNL